MNNKTLKSVGAVFAGIVAGVALTLGTDEVLHLFGVFPPWGQAVTDGPLALATAYRAVFGVVAGYVTARLAPNRPMEHALVGGVMGLIVSTIGAVATWNKGPAFGPHWYPIALVVIAIPCAWMGGLLQHRSQAQS